MRLAIRIMCVFVAVVGVLSQLDASFVQHEQGVRQTVAGCAFWIILGFFIYRAAKDPSKEDIPIRATFPSTHGEIIVPPPPTVKKASPPQQKLITRAKCRNCGGTDFQIEQI